MVLASRCPCAAPARRSRHRRRRHHTQTPRDERFPADWETSAYRNRPRSSRRLAQSHEEELDKLQVSVTVVHDHDDCSCPATAADDQAADHDDQAVYCHDDATAAATDNPAGCGHDDDAADYDDQAGCCHDKAGLEHDDSWSASPAATAEAAYDHDDPATASLDDPAAAGLDHDNYQCSATATDDHDDDAAYHDDNAAAAYHDNDDTAAGNYALRRRSGWGGLGGLGSSRRHRDAHRRDGARHRPDGGLPRWGRLYAGRSLEAHRRIRQRVGDALLPRWDCADHACSKQ